MDNLLTLVTIGPPQARSYEILGGEEVLKLEVVWKWECCTRNGLYIMGAYVVYERGYVKTFTKELAVSQITRKAFIQSSHTTPMIEIVFIQCLLYTIAYNPTHALIQRQPPLPQNNSFQ